MSIEGQVGKAPKPPGIGLLVYDGSCGFCRRWVARMLHLDWRRTVRAVPLQDPTASLLTGRAPAQLEQAVHLVRADGVVFAGAAAVREMLRGFRGGWMVTVLSHVPGVMSVAGWVYREIAHRWGPLPRPSLAGAPAAARLREDPQAEDSVQ